MSKGLVDIAFDKLWDAIDGDAIVGRRGERLTEKELNFIKLLGRDGEVIRNVYVPIGNDKTSEIDVIFITTKGIFVIESKNYSGWIFGNEKDSQWTMVLPNKEKHRFYNPIKQNKTHIKCLTEYLEDKFPDKKVNMFSLIVFSERCELKKITVESDVKVIKRDYLYAAVRNIWKETEDCISEEDVRTLKSLLANLADVSKEEKKEHIKQIKEDLENRCPLCGANLILRTAKKGEHAGQQFYGCSNYPKCRYIKNRIRV